MHQSCMQLVVKSPQMRLEARKIVTDRDRRVV
jgi:hypothetical protein